MMSEQEEKESIAKESICYLKMKNVVFKFYNQATKCLVVMRILCLGWRRKGWQAHT